MGHGLSAFWLLSCSAFHDAAHGAFMRLPPYTSRIREGEAPQLGGVVPTPCGRAFKVGNALHMGNLTDEY
jgi:hypothetical protein